ncbi:MULTISPECIES: thioredoxin domain-containing protein [Niastella]|uniref:Thioredoxin domain-containing protein n=1 Tax=Niastella soli TaxID=2821487 RepID=A0ABS3YQT7_9BACT|nr:thioredoxin domain-containing protein [Niastella soli]MBO9200258.1 thioredoxin domain-containing protein [Niastella soli]
MATHTNRLAQETSPYLLQHAHNPVDWYPWGDEALGRAKQEDKPVLVSIGYAACHWCHVMEKESFENEETAALMNEHFINIKIDREERPDLDHIYMDAVQAMTGSGGWPLNIFLTPDGRPFYGGTYYPPKAIYNRPSWRDVLTGVANAWAEKRNDIDAQANNLTGHIEQSNSFGLQVLEGDVNIEALFSKEIAEIMFNNIMGTADKEEGGFGNAPKFPQTFTIGYLLRYYHLTGNQQALDQACLSLDKMIQGGLYDHLGGGFARYSTDREWLVPHFEKMLYDNALLVSVLCDAWQLTQKPLYKQAVSETLAFVERELFSQNFLEGGRGEAGFYSALDADSEGVEGKFYVWSKTEIETVLQQDAALFCAFYDVTEGGNWEHTNILNIRKPLEQFAIDNNQSVQTLQGLLQQCREKLLKYREDRIRPLLDDKILLGWNALMNTAYSKAYSVFGEPHYAQVAQENMDFIWERFTRDGQEFFHTYKKEVARYPAFLDDYAYLIQALIYLQEITGNADYLYKAKSLTQWVIDQFSEENTGYFFYTNKGQQDVIVRKKEVYDGAIPSGNAIMAFNLQYLGVVFDMLGWKERAIKMCAGLQQAVHRYPGSFGVWATIILSIAGGVEEIAIIGKNVELVRRELLQQFIPFRVLQSASQANSDLPLLASKPPSPDTQIYLCKNYQCSTPVNKVSDLIRLLKNV